MKKYEIAEALAEVRMTPKQKEIMSIIKQEGGYNTQPHDMPSIRSLRSKGMIKQAAWPDLRWVAA